MVSAQKLALARNRGRVDAATEKLDGMLAASRNVAAQAQSARGKLDSLSVLRATASKYVTETEKRNSLDMDDPRHLSSDEVNAAAAAARLVIQFHDCLETLYTKASDPENHGAAAQLAHISVAAEKVARIRFGDANTRWPSDPTMRATKESALLTEAADLHGDITEALKSTPMELGIQLPAYPGKALN